MIRKESKIDEFIRREAKAVKELIKSGSINNELISFDIFIENLIDDYQIDDSQLEYLKEKSRERLNLLNVKIQGL
ncbi:MULTISPECIES: hypothetical protein [Flammeovirga]|uniref:Uncharacterized protein n=1 Tax=Flammeovirga agarivorans TaxID=2726742 RepID=A0A7X8SLG3_9BACT|nr:MULTISPECIES: hypothetical protein [Flammeovirga]NLR92398.1 hypothetical protein [Flammeovirga agarivorans]